MDSPNDKTERLYMLEFLVDRLNLTSEKLADFGSTPITIVLEFLDFPAFVISESEFLSSRRLSEQKGTILSKDRKIGGDVTLNMGAGKSCLFSRRPETLIEAMRSQTLKINVYKRAPVTKICSREEPELPVCKTEVPFPDCLCDLVSMARNDEAHLPKPYTTRNTWNLIDQLGQPAGTVLLFLKLTCLGQSVGTQFALKDDYFLFKNTNSSDEFQCVKIPRPDEVEGLSGEHQEPEVNPSSVIGLASICSELAKRDGGPAAIPRLKPVTSQCYEPRNTPTILEDCICRPATLRNNFSCNGENQSRSCSESMKRTLAGVHAACSPSRPRMRGGGPWTAICDTKTVRSINRPDATQSVEDLLSGACKSPSKSGKPGCGCFGKLGTGATGTFKSTFERRDFGCANPPCQGIDCLIRAFKETEDFVESIGRVPGCAGLGLTDPADSPYFRRERDAPTSCCQAPSMMTQANSAYPMTKPDQAYNVLRSETGLSRLRKKIDDRTMEKQREVLPEPLSHPEPEVGSGPCGETSCKSRKKKPPELSEVSDEQPAKNISVIAKAPNSRKPKQRSKSKTVSVSRTDHRHSRRSSHVRVSKPVMKLVEAYRDSKTCYGHKNCLDARVRVPGDMGWLWNSVDACPGRFKIPIGWKPGAVSKFAWERLQQAKKAMLAETSSSVGELHRSSSTTTRSKKSRAPRSKSVHSVARSQWTKPRMLETHSNEIELPPTLHVHRKDGTYYITMYPVRAEGTPDKTDEPVKPLQFKVTKNRDADDATSSSTGSDLEIEFSPPAALTRYTKKDPTVDHETQVRQQDILDALKVPEETKQTKKPRKVKHKK